MSDRQNPYFRAAMHNEWLEAECRESAAWLEKMAESDASREAASPNAAESDQSGEGLKLPRKFLLGWAKAEREAAEKHARLREKMEPFL